MRQEPCSAPGRTDTSLPAPGSCLPGAAVTEQLPCHPLGPLLGRRVRGRQGAVAETGAWRQPPQDEEASAGCTARGDSLCKGPEVGEWVGHWMS